VAQVSAKMSPIERFLREKNDLSKKMSTLTDLMVNMLNFKYADGFKIKNNYFPAISRVQILSA
jgi:hypothetical protein